MMQQTFDAIRNIFTNMQAIGWAPWPLVFACAGTIVARLAMEDDVLIVNSVEAKRKQGRAKMIAFGIGYVVSIAACYGFDHPKNTDETIQVFMFSILNSGLGYLAWSMYVIFDPISRFKDHFGKKDAAAVPVDGAK